MRRAAQDPLPPPPTTTVFLTFPCQESGAVSPGDSSAAADIEAQALVALKALHLDHLHLAEIDNLEAFDQVKELYLQSNALVAIDNLDFLTNLEILALNRNSIGRVEGLAHLSKLQVLDLADNAIELGELDVDALPRHLKMLDLRRNPWIGGAEATDAEMAEVRARVIGARPDLHELNGVPVTVAERRACLGGTGFDAWAQGIEGQRQHTLYINIVAEKPGERDHVARLDFSAADDLRAVAAKFCAVEGISDVEGATPELLSQMREMIDAPVNRSRSGLGRGRRALAGLGGGEGKGDTEGKGSAEAGEEWSALELLQRQAQALEGSGALLGDELEGVFSATRRRMAEKREAMKKRSDELKAKRENDVDHARRQQLAMVQNAEMRREEEKMRFREIRREALAKRFGNRLRTEEGKEEGKAGS